VISSMCDRLPGGVLAHQSAMLCRPSLADHANGTILPHTGMVPAMQSLHGGAGMSSEWS